MSDLTYSVRRTGVFAASDEVQACIRLFKLAKSHPVATDTEPGLTRAAAEESVNKAVHGYALAHGLPAIDDRYCMDVENGEFLEPVEFEN